MHLMNIDEKYLLANQIQQYKKWIIHYNQIGCTKVSLTFKMNVKKNQSNSQKIKIKEKKYMIISTDEK